MTNQFVRGDLVRITVADAIVPTGMDPVPVGTVDSVLVPHYPPPEGGRVLLAHYPACMVDPAKLAPVGHWTLPGQGFMWRTAYRPRLARFSANPATWTTGAVGLVTAVGCSVLPGTSLGVIAGPIVATLAGFVAGGIANTLARRLSPPQQMAGERVGLRRWRG
jgi:hypothetical protein